MAEQVRIRIIPPLGAAGRVVEVPRLAWRRDGGYWSSCGRYFIDRTPSTAVGPWLVHHDPAGENAGWSEMIFPRSDTMREAKLKAALHAAGVTLGEYDRVEEAGG